MSTRRPARLRLGFLILLLCFGIVAATPSAASALVGQLAIKNVPYIQTAGTGDSYARASTEIGTTVYVGGKFSKCSSRCRAPTTRGLVSSPITRRRSS